MDAAKLTAFQHEYLWELSIPKVQVISLAQAVPEEAYGWRPGGDARSFSEAMVHIACGILMLLYRAEAYGPEVMKFCGALEGEGTGLWLEMVHRSLEKEKSLRTKAEVIELLQTAFSAVEKAFSGSSEEKLSERRDFGGELTTARRIYLRILAHTHEHMGQVIAYAREMGFHVPWPDPVRELERMAATQMSR